MNVRCFYIGLAIWFFGVIPIGFAEDFQNRPALSELNELVAKGMTYGNAVRERDLVVNRNWIFSPYCGLWQSYFASLQSELEYLAPKYVDHVNGPLNENKTAFRYFTLLTWQAASGLNTNGFRRTGWDGVLSYGYAQVGDIIGPWIFEDLQKGFSALQQVVWGNLTIEYKSKSVSTGQQAQSPEQVRQICITMWNAASWGGGGYVAARAQAAGNFYIDKFGREAATMQAYRDAWKVTLLFSEDCVERSVDEYFQPQIYETFYDIDQMGLEGQGILTKIKEIPAFSDTEYELEWIGEGNDVCPWALIEEELSDPPPNYSHDYAYRGGTTYIVKPNFTHQNP